MTCDQCGNELVGYGLQIRATAGGGLATFHDEHWNGGDFCSLECASEALREKLPPARMESAAKAVRDQEEEHAVSRTSATRGL